MTFIYDIFCSHINGVQNLGKLNSDQNYGKRTQFIDLPISKLMIRHTYSIQDKIIV